MRNHLHSPSGLGAIGTVLAVVLVSAIVVWSMLYERSQCRKAFASVRTASDSALVALSRPVHNGASCAYWR